MCVLVVTNFVFSLFLTIAESYLNQLHRRRQQHHHQYGTVVGHHSAGAAATELRRYDCTDCGKSYSARGNLSRHRRQECAYSQTAIDLKCFLCSYVTRRQDTLKKHVLTHVKGAAAAAATVGGKMIIDKL